MPYIKTAKPIRIRPTSRRRWRLEPMISRMPARAIRGEKFSGFRRFTNTFSLSMPVRERIHAVSVVPMLEPMMTPMVCPSSMTPEFTRPTSITVMAEEDWMAMVMPAPSSRLLMGFEVMRLSIRSSLPPAIFSRLLDMTVMPYKKKAKPPQRVKTEKISITAPRFIFANFCPAGRWWVCHVYCTDTLYMQILRRERAFCNFCKICVKSPKNVRSPGPPCAKHPRRKRAAFPRGGGAPAVLSLRVHAPASGASSVQKARTASAARRPSK